MMKRIAVIILLAAMSFNGFAQDGFAQLDSLLDVYCRTMQQEPQEVKQNECDFMIRSAEDSITRQHIARKLFDYYVAAPLMGEESIAIYLYDKWFATGTLSVGNEFAQMDAEIFVTFNRNNQIGMDAPVLSLADAEGAMTRLPSEGRTSVLFFFDVTCSKCRAQIGLFPSVLADVDFPLDFFAVYCGSDEDAWGSFRDSFSIGNSNINVIHLWDPDMDSDYQRQYGVISTPKVFVVEPTGTILGRRLEPDSLKELLVYAGAVQKIYDEYK